jgi:hypothetical protein
LFTRHHQRAVFNMADSLSVEFKCKNSLWTYGLLQHITPGVYTFSRYIYVSQLKILYARKLTWGQFHTEDSQIFGATVHNSVTTSSWHKVFMHPCITPSIIPEEHFLIREYISSRWYDKPFEIHKRYRRYFISRCQMQAARAKETLTTLFWTVAFCASRKVCLERNSLCMFSCL